MKPAGILSESYSDLFHFEHDGVGRALGVADAVAFAEDRIHPGLASLGRVAKDDGVVGAGVQAGSAGDAGRLVHLANGAGRGDRFLGEEGRGPAGPRPVPSLRCTRNASTSKPASPVREPTASPH